MTNRIRSIPLLDTFGIERQALRIFLRQDRDAEGGD